MKIIWNYDDIHNDILSIYVKKDCIGYFKLTDDDFRIIEYPTTRISMIVLKQIVEEYPDALHEAKRIVEIE